MAYSENPLRMFVGKLTRHSPLDDEERRAILRLPGHSIDIRSNYDIVRLGERVEEACLVVSGLIGRFGQNAEGSRQVTAIHIQGDMADLHSVVSPSASCALQALTNATLLKVPHSAIKELARAYPMIAEAFWRECVLDAAVLSEWTVNVGRRDARTRAAHLLCEMAWRYEAVGEQVGFSFEFPVTQQHLADMLALTPVHVNRTLKALRLENLADVHGGRVNILDWSRLVKAGDFNPAYLQSGTREEPRPAPKLRLVPSQRPRMEA